MSERPLLPLPSPLSEETPKTSPGRDRLITPGATRQVARFGATFDHLQRALESESSVLTLREDPTSLAPERAIVFEVAGSIENLQAAITKIDGLELLLESESEFEADE